MSKPKVIVSRSWPEEVERHMAEVFDVQLNEDDVAMTADEMRAALQSCDAFCPTVTDAVDADVLGVADATVKIIGSNGVGFNHIDLDAAMARINTHLDALGTGIAVSNFGRVAQHLLGGMTLCDRHQPIPRYSW